MTSSRDNEDLFEDYVVLPVRRSLRLVMDRDDTPERVFGGESTDTEEDDSCKPCCSCHSCSSRSSRWMSKPRLGANLSDDTDCSDCDE